MPEFYNWKKDPYFVGAASRAQTLGEEDGVRHLLPLDISDRVVREAYFETMANWQAAERLAVTHPVESRERVNEMDIALMQQFGLEVGRIIFSHARNDVAELQELIQSAPGTLDM